MRNPSPSSNPGGRIGAAHPARPWKSYDPEHAYDEWQRRFVHRLAIRLPDVTRQQLQAAAHTWAHHFDEIEPEEAAEIASMWWHSPLRASHLA